MVTLSALATYRPWAAQAPTADAASKDTRKTLTTTATVGWLTAVAAVTSYISLTVAGKMSAFEDEGLYLFMGHREIAHLLHGSRLIESPDSYFSGAPWLYPPIAAVADYFGGLTGARVLSLAFVLLTGLAVYGTTKELYGRRAGLIANAVFLLNGSVLYLSHLATFDAMAMLLIAIAAWLAVRSSRNRLIISIPIIALVLMLAFFTKYTSVVFVPVVALIIAVQGGGRRTGYMGLRRAVYLVVAFALATWFVIQIFSRDLIKGIETTTFSRAPMHVASYGALAALVLLWVGPWLAAAAISFAGTPRASWAVRATLLLGAVAVPIVQIRTHEETSLSKHVAFGMVFAAPLIGDLVNRLLTATRNKAVPTVLAMLLVFSWCGEHFSGQFLTSWINDPGLVHTLATDIKVNPSKAILGEEGSAERYALRNQLYPGQWCDTYSFSYGGDVGQAAYAKAIQQSHFGVIYLTLTTPNGRWIQQYLNTHSTPYILSDNVSRYFRGRIVGDWLVYTPRVSL